MKYVIDVPKISACSECQFLKRPTGAHSDYLCGLKHIYIGKHIFVNGFPDSCQLVPYDEYKIAKPYVNHGDHGPEPRFKGDAWTMWYCCGNCDHPISPEDNYCKTCGAKIDWSDCV